MMWRLALVLLVGFALAACADKDKSTGDNDRFGGFYGGMDGGGGFSR